MSGRLLARRLRYVAGEADSLYLHALRNRFLRTPNVSVKKLDPVAPEDFASLGEPFDTALCINMLEYVEQPDACVANLVRILRQNGRLLILVPQGESLCGRVDEAMGHRRRFRLQSLRRMLEAHGLEVERTRQLNKASKPVWWFTGKVLRRKRINKPILKLFDKTVWLWRLLDPILPWQGLSLIVVARKRGD